MADRLIRSRSMIGRYPIDIHTDTCKCVCLCVWERILFCLSKELNQYVYLNLRLQITRKICKGWH